MVAFQYVIELSEPINVLSELSVVQFETQKYLVRENGDTNWKKNEYTDQIIIFDSSKNELENHEERFMKTDLYEIYSKTNNFSITERISELFEMSENKQKLLRDAFNKLKNNNNESMHTHTYKHDITDDKHPYFGKTIVDLEQMFKTKFHNQYVFTGYEIQIINSVVHNQYVKDKIKKIHWIEKI